MLVSVIVGLSIILGIIFIIVGNKYNDDLEISGWILGTLSLVVAIFVVTLGVMWPRDIEMTKAKYYELQREVQQVSKLGGQECDLTILARKDLFEAIREMNETIDKNRIYCTSPWINWFYSEEIGNLEKLNYVYEGD